MAWQNSTWAAEPGGPTFQGLLATRRRWLCQGKVAILLPHFSPGVRGKSGDKIWLRALYNPVLDENGKPVKIVKFATDVSADKRRNAETKGMLEAINRSQAVIEFDLDGTVLTANDNFLRIFDYDLKDIVGNHHRMFCDQGYTESTVTPSSGKSCREGTMSQANSSALTAKAPKSGFRPRTTLSSTGKAA